MKTVVLIYAENGDLQPRRFAINPKTEDEVHEAKKDVNTFMDECYSDIKDGEDDE